MIRILEQQKDSDQLKESLVAGLNGILLFGTSQAIGDYEERLRVNVARRGFGTKKRRRLKGMNRKRWIVERDASTELD